MITCHVLLVLVLPEALAIDFRSQSLKRLEQPQSGWTPAEPTGRNPYQQFENLPTLVPSDGLFEPPYSNGIYVPSFPIVGGMFTTTETVPIVTNPSPSPSSSQPTATPTSTQSTVTVWTTTASAKPKAKMSKLSSRPVKNETAGGTAAHVSVPSHRLLNDILVIPSSRRLYILAIIPIHESADSQGFECGRVDVNGFLRLAAFLDALAQVNSNRILKETGLSLGAVIIDSCSSDLRTVADLFELLSGTNIQKSDVVAIVRDDGAHLPNVDKLVNQLRLPSVNTFFSTKPQPLTTGTLPLMSSVLEAMFGLLAHTNSTCVSVLHDELHDYSAGLLAELSVARGVCLEQTIQLKAASKSDMQTALRRLLLTEARIVIVLLGDENWLDLMKAMRSELVSFNLTIVGDRRSVHIAGRFILLSPQQPQWSASKRFLEQWPQFDQLLLTVSPQKPSQQSQLLKLASKIATLPFPQHWLRQFWATAFQCHIDGEANPPGQQFSKACSHKQNLNISAIAPDLDISPISIAVNTIAHATRKLVDEVCPGALIQHLSDCINDPHDLLYSTMLQLQFWDPLSSAMISFNDTTAFRDHPVVVNRVMFDAQLESEPIAEWNSLTGFTYAGAAELVMEERDGSRVPLQSTCLRSKCSSDLARRSVSSVSQSFRESLNSVAVLVYTICAVLAFFICLMCLYQQVVCKAETFRFFTAFTFGGVAALCLVSIAFFMTPNLLSCFVRRVLFPIAVSAVFAPITVKSLCIWRAEVLASRGEVRRAVSHHSSLLFWLCPAIVLLQIVISSEWAVFESSTQLTFVVSAYHGDAWRCAPGDNFEHRILWSSILTGLMIVTALVFSTLTVRRVESRQNILISVLAIVLIVSLYIGLPLIAYRRRDIIFAAVQLALCFVIVLISYCRRAFDAGENDSSNISLVPSSGRQSQQIQPPYWVDTRMNRLTQQKNYEIYNTAATVQQRKAEEEGRKQAARTNSHLAHVRSDSYDVAPIPVVKYGLNEFVMDDENDEPHQARL
ncbi:hypothetical protein Q1695_016215 [Nippostrongylus brasiliensis]|nr:hypothetical protein Q1695_016215 [Nippostrongylus brasiliensis]